ncbi:MULTISPECIES: hypothetical protein [unclassified Micromonospora]|uniref:hypothetical protein n=1 Tax=unclassified Micromonospora TaxID=2617518 RepID=UPI001C5DD12F|nr:hypothetical protein [Micromonospora sp. RL09-050-HVF-A]MBW4701921.1 hypothetical protein [Micromonospora sp. RL09-050-HVF-A]
MSRPASVAIPGPGSRTESRASVGRRPAAAAPAYLLELTSGGDCAAAGSPLRQWRFDRSTNLPWTVAPG